MTTAIVDGRRRFSCSLTEFYARHDIVQAAATAGVLVPPIAPANLDAEPALAFVNPLTPMEPVARWICRCPDCPGGSAYVWLEQPIMFCLSCGNRSIGGRWRTVTLPPDPGAIEALLMQRPDVANMVWVPGESLTLIRAHNEMLGVV